MKTMKTIGKIKKTCKFCGNDFVVYAGNHSVSRPYDFCSKRCATMYRYRKHSSTPFPPIEDIKSFWNKERYPISRIVGKFVRKFPEVPFIEASNEALYIVASALRFTKERLAIFARVKGGLIDYFLKFHRFNIPYSPLEEVSNVIIQMEAEVKKNENKCDYNLFRKEIEQSEIKCMKILKDYLASVEREEIKRKYSLNRTSDIDTNIRNAVHHLRLIAENGKVKKDLKLEKHLEAIKEDLNQNVPLKQMLKKYDCSKSCFFDFLRKNGISPNKNRKRDMLLQNIENIRTDLRNGMIRKDVQKKYNCSKSTLERLIKNYNLRDYAIAN
jgi:hypothetical protein